MPLNNYTSKTGINPAEELHDFQQTSGQSPVVNHPYAPIVPEQYHPHAQGFGQAIGLTPIAAMVAITTDAMVSAVNVASLGISAPFLWLIASIFVGVITFLSQRKWGGDDVDGAFIKALIVAFLTALPTPLPSFLTVPSAIVGTVQLLRNRK